MRALITSLLICGVLVVLFLGLGSNMVQAQRGGEPTPTPRPTLPPRLPPAPGTRIPINDNLFITADEKGILYFVDRSGNPVSVISKDMKPPPGNTKPVIPLPQPYRSPVGGAGVRGAERNKHPKLGRGSPAWLPKAGDHTGSPLQDGTIYFFHVPKPKFRTLKIG
jgi:hypothetical protein